VRQVGYLQELNRDAQSKKHKILGGICLPPCLGWGQDSVVSIVTGYGLGGPGFESQQGQEIFCGHSDRPWGLPSLCTMCVTFLS